MSEIIFVIGKPGSGKTTAAAYLKDAYENHDHDLSVALIDEYRILRESLDKLDEQQIERHTDGSFTITDRTVFAQTFETLKQQLAHAATQHDVVICEFSRNQYWPLMESVMDSMTSDFSVIYVSSLLDVCESRNQARQAQSPAAVIPEGIIQQYYARDDMDVLRQKLAGRLQVVKNNRDGKPHLLAAVKKLFNDRSFQRNTNRTPVIIKPEPWQERLIAAGLMAYLLVSLAGIGWALEIFPEVDDTRRTLAMFMLAGFAGCFGSTLYCIRSFYSYYIAGVFDYQRFKWWYVFRPVTGFMLAIALLALVTSQLIGISAGQSQDLVQSQLSIFAIAFLAGFTTEQVVERLRKASKALFGEEGDKGHKA